MPLHLSIFTRTIALLEVLYSRLQLFYYGPKLDHMATLKGKEGEYFKFGTLPPQIKMSHASKEKIDIV